MNNKKISELDPLGDGELSEDDLIHIVDTSEGINKRIPAGKLFGGSGRKFLTQDTTYYVGIAGDDNNDGLTLQTPFRTPERAFDLINKEIDAQGYTIKIILGDGVYTPVGQTFHLPVVVGADPDSCAGPPPPLPNAPLQLEGNSPATILEGVELDHEQYVSLSTLTVRAVDLIDGFTSGAIRVSRHGTMELHGVTIESDLSSRNGIIAKEGGDVVIRNPLVFSKGNFGYPFFATENGVIRGDTASYGRITFDAAVNCTNFAYAESGGRIDFRASSITDNSNSINTVLVRNGSVLVPNNFLANLTNINPFGNPTRSGYYTGNVNQIPAAELFAKLNPGTPTATNVADGAIQINQGDNKLAFKSNDTWHELSSGTTITNNDEPYIDIIGTGENSLVSSSANNGIAIGPDSSIGNNSTHGISIGFDADIADDSPNNISIGNNSSISQLTSGSTAIGNSAFIGVNDDNAIALGGSTRIEAGGSVALGHGAKINGLGAGGIAIGFGATVGASNAIQLGFGTNSQPSTLQYANVRIATAGHGIMSKLFSGPPANAATTGSFGLDTTADTLYYSSDGWQKIAQGDYIQINSENGGLAAATGASAIAFGKQAQSSAETAISIGFFANTSALNSVAIGRSAIVESSAEGAIQLGAGTNTTALTLQFLDTTIANRDGIQLPVSQGAPTTAPADGSLAVDNTAGAEKLMVRVNGQWLGIPLSPTVE